MPNPQKPTTEEREVQTEVNNRKQAQATQQKERKPEHTLVPSIQERAVKTTNHREIKTNTSTKKQQDDPTKINKTKEQTRENPAKNGREPTKEKNDYQSGNEAKVKTTSKHRLMDIQNNIIGLNEQKTEPPDPTTKTTEKHTTPAPNRLMDIQNNTNCGNEETLQVEQKTEPPDRTTKTKKGTQSRD